MIGYRNYESPEETNALLPEEIEMQQKVAAAAQAVHDMRNKLHTLELRKSLLQVRCPHTVFVNRLNDPHDHRVCVICGMSLGMI